MEINGYNIEDYAEDAVILTGMDEAIIGVVETMGTGPRILYSKNKILEILSGDDMTLEEAEEYYDFNILNLWVSDQNPVFLISE
jgi:hypothetical protein